MSIEYFTKLVEEKDGSAEAQPQETPNVEPAVADAPSEGIMSEADLQALENDSNFNPELKKESTTSAIEDTPPAQEAVTLREDVKAINDFLSHNPDKNIDDYLRIQKGAEGLSVEDRLTTYLTEKEGLSQLEVELRLLEIMPDEDDDDLDYYEEGSKEWKQAKREKLEAQATLDRVLKEADAYFEEKKQPQANKTNTAQAVTEPTNPQEAEAMAQAQRESYLKSIYQASDTLSDLTVNIGDRKVSLRLDETMKSSVRRIAEDVSESIKPFFSDNFTDLKDPAGFLKEYASWNSPQVREAVLQEVLRQGIEIGKSESIKDRRNITLGGGQSNAPINSPSREQALEALYKRSKVVRS